MRPARPLIVLLVLTLGACDSEATVPEQTIVLSETSSPSAEPTSIPPPTPPAADSDLLDVGNIVAMPLRSVQGATGTITIERGEDTGGYRLVPDPSSETHFFIELFGTYQMDVAPETAQWGDLDWRVEGADGAAVGAEVLRAFPEPEERGSLGNWPGATVPEDRYQGWIIFAVPRGTADVALELVYQPDGVDEETRFPLRNSAEAPTPVVAEWPRPDPVYMSQDGLEITVLESVDADSLFADADTCTNPDGGYTVSFPESWYTNTAIGDISACSWFSPTFYQATPGGPRPDEIAIDIRVFEGAVGFIWADLYSEEVTLDGVGARRAETGMTKDAGTPTKTFQYTYLARLDDDPTEGRKLWAFTGTDYGGTYELNKAVLDRIMASIEWID